MIMDKSGYELNNSNQLNPVIIQKLHDTLWVLLNNNV